MTAKLIIPCCLLLLVVSGCKKENKEAAPAAGEIAPATEKAAAPAKPAPAPAPKKSAFPATEAGAKALLEQFLKPGADHAALSMQLKPTSADYRAVFASEEHAAKAEQAYAGLWGMVQKRPIQPKAGQTELLLWSATTDELKQGTGNAGKFPGGYNKAAPHLKPGLTVYRFKFVEPGKTLGMAFDGLYNLDGRWVLMPKPWRITR